MRLHSGTIESEDAFRKQAERVRSVSQNRAVLDGDLKSAFPEIVAAAAEGLKCDRVTIWIYNAEYTEVRSVCELNGGVILSSEKILGPWKL